jgi:23S rRNA-/tRNA-specific pseudouridylate synthase
MHDDHELTEEYIRRQYAQRQFQKRYAALLRQELELEEQLMDDPAIAPLVHQVNLLESQQKLQGTQSVLDSRTTEHPRIQGVFKKLFPGFG